MKAAEVFDYLKSLNGGWVDYEKSVDAFKAGKPETEVAGIAVGWMGYTWAIEKAAELGCNLFITHEPIYYDHWDRRGEGLVSAEANAKRDRIEALGMAVLRCHDLWDQFPDIGIPDSWGKKLGLAEPIGGEGYYRVYDGGGRPAVEIARELVARVADLGQEAAELVGPPETPVRRIVIGTGAITPFQEMLKSYEGDLILCTDDGFTYWRDGAFAIDNGCTVLVFNHPVAEDHGMELLAGHLGGKFAPLPVHFIRQSCMYRLVGQD